MTDSELRALVTRAEAALSAHVDDPAVRELGAYLRLHPLQVDYVEKLMGEAMKRNPTAKP